MKRCKPPCMLAASIVCAAPLGGVAAPIPRLLLDFDKGETIKDPASAAIVAPQSKADFRPTIDQGTRAKPEIVSQGCQSPPSCLRIALIPSIKGAVKNKIMYSFWSHHRPLPGGELGRMRIGDGKVTRISFSMKLDTQYDTPLAQMIHFQVYQSNKYGGHAKAGTIEPGGPILSLRIVPASRRKNKSRDVQEFILSIRSPQAGRLRYFDQRDPGVIYRGELRKGEWNSFAFVLQSKRVNSDVAGRIAFWLNGKKAFDKSIAWGFNPARYPSNPNLGVELGSYRSADAKGEQIVYFDDVRIER